MPERDDTVEIEMPSLQASKGDEAIEHDVLIDAADHAIEPASGVSLESDVLVNDGVDQPPSSGSPAYFNKMLIGLCGVFIAALIFSFVLMQQQSNEFMNAESRIADLESRLSTTDESVSQSSVALQVKVKELKDRTNELEKQMDKLWASAWRRNQNEIASHTKSIEMHGKSLKETVDILDDLQTLNKRLEKDVGGLKKNSANVKSFKGSLKKQQESVTRLQQSLKSLQQSQLSIKATAEENSEWIQSINVFRKQTNQTISQIEKQLNLNKGK